MFNIEFEMCNPRALRQNRCSRTVYDIRSDTILYLVLFLPTGDNEWPLVRFLLDTYVRPLGCVMFTRKCKANNCSGQLTDRVKYYNIF